MSADVAAAFDAFPVRARGRLLEVRAQIFRVAGTLDRVGALTEGLRWGQPAYLTAASGSGSTIRLGLSGGHEPGAAVFFNCRTELIEMFRDRFPGAFRYEKSRAILLDAPGPLPDAPLSICLGLALTYRQRRYGRRTSVTA